LLLEQPYEMSEQSLGHDYAGDIEPAAVWKALRQAPAAQMVDVRTQAEWSFVGLPDLSTLGRSVLLCEWQAFPSMAENPNFVRDMDALLRRAGYDKGAPLYFLCRSGARSRFAAIAMTAAGYGPCFNIQDGFEGPLDRARHRGEAAGWKAAGLPWMQS
jgi:rhodanese-related sulfurtransferase